MTEHAQQHARRVAGWIGKKEGDGWEAALDRTHDEYARCGIALVEKKPTPTRPLEGGRQRQGPPLLVYAARSSYDYHGVLGCKPEPGQAIAMEAKNNTPVKTSMRVALLTKQEAGKDGPGDGLQWHQLVALHRALVFNGLAVVVWANGITHPAGARLVLLPDKVLDVYERAEAKRGKAKSISIPRSWFTEFRQRRIDRSGDVIEDWLAPVIEWMTARKGAGHG